MLTCGLDAHLRRLGSAAADLEPREGQGTEPPPADGEGQAFSMTDVAHASGSPEGAEAPPSSAASSSGTARGGSAGRQGTEPAPADGEGPAFSMSDVAAGTGGEGPTPRQGRAASARGGLVSLYPPQDGHYHFAKGDEAGLESGDTRVDASWTSLEEPEAVERVPPGLHGTHHMPEYVGEPEEGGFKEPGQDIASALPRRQDTEEYGLNKE
ncbi:hypothetical protein CHLNCDRAFT_133570 [Chlorella variabilis]|uniref:Uncharacterized protein n=1 Tax=Chlorella variabilis TaxID=554065 RepID=E1Z3D3_CHLVA|nr:hypothetical protein CHLNCDRAFT_133570 [Chlorella variabilis]EFN59823.1 hypothetical protein CHLNCDRAFT_133570 [Chlorella variabilis]|eukprot:XP_005851925.1 hypothetical protein CHLNCDRAFT_133570 [Chlorella variabilis]